jgi:hypothetical protein
MYRTKKGMLKAVPSPTTISLITYSSHPLRPSCMNIR